MKLSYTCLFLLISYNLSAQPLTVRGKITDQQGQPVPFASIYEKNTTIGTSANSEGEYSLKLNAGKHDLHYKAIGYRQEVREIDLTTNYNLDVTLTQAVFELADVVVRSDGEDPAFEVIRNAIRKRKAHLREADEYSTDVYIKGMQKLLAAPKKFFGKNIDDLSKEIGLDSNRTGILYLSESESRLSYMQPDQYREEMISSKVSGSNRAFSFNRASDINMNFYENMINMEGLSNRPFISPIAETLCFIMIISYSEPTWKMASWLIRFRFCPREMQTQFSEEIFISLKTAGGSIVQNCILQNRPILILSTL